MEYTPGKWEVNRPYDTIDPCIHTERVGNFIQCFVNGYISEKEALANAHLIVAVVDLLKACKMVVKYVDEGIRVESEYSEMCRKAIAQVEGRR